MRKSAVISLRNGDAAPLAWIGGDPLTDDRQRHVRIRSSGGREEAGGQGDAGFTPLSAGSLFGMSITSASLER